MNSALRLPKERAEALSPQDLEGYLLTHGWKEDTAASTKKVGEFRHRTVPEATVRVPRDRRFLDYALRVGDVLEAIAVIERRPAWEVFADVSAPKQAPSANGPAEGEGSSPGRKAKRKSS
jgi:hypothetical protein